jgi:hypothetical protein
MMRARQQRGHRGVLWVAKGFSAILLVCIVYLGLLAHPEPLFSYSARFTNITFYSGSPISPQIGLIASAVVKRLVTSEIYDSTLRQRVFIVDRPWLWNLLNGPYRRAIARNVEIGNAILVPRLDVPRQVITHFDGRSTGAVAVLTHESVHTLVEHRIGLLRLWRLQWWQKEGYAEYVASRGGTESEAPDRYRRAAERWKYLLETEHLTFDQVIN